MNRDKVVLLGSLYLAQGLPFGFFTQALPVVLRDEGYDLPAIGASSALALPWAFKFLWAPLVDRYHAPSVGRRRSWLLPLQALTVLLVAGLAFVRPGGAIAALAVGMFATSLLAATQDIATDGLAVEVLTPEERGLGNGLQVAGYRLGMILGGGALLVVFDELGWTATFVTMAALLALASLPVWLHREVSDRAPAESLAAVLRAMRRPGWLGWMGLLIAYKAGDALAGGMIRVFLKDANLSMSEIGLLVGVAGSVAGLLGALLGGYLAWRLGRVQALIVCGLAQALAVGLYVIPALGEPSRELLWAVGSVEHFAGGMATAALFTAMMDVCRPGVEASDYTLQASAVVLGTGVGASVSGLVAKQLGYAGHFGLSAMVCLAGLGIVMLWLPGAARRLGSEEMSA
ncbi:MAG: MFS transporter [Deltaproteobacteria bacterium]|nr:MAG: MFS transporter [Deltaproteobacteria bacterium]